MRFKLDTRNVGTLVLGLASGIPTILISLNYMSGANDLAAQYPNSAEMITATAWACVIAGILIILAGIAVMASPALTKSLMVALGFVPFIAGFILDYRLIALGVFSIIAGIIAHVPSVERTQHSWD